MQFTVFLNTFDGTNSLDSWAVNVYVCSDMKGNHVFLKKKKKFGQSSIQIPFFLDVEHNCSCRYIEPIILKFSRIFLSLLLFARLIVTPLLFLNLRHALLYKFSSFIDLEDQKLKWDAGSNNTICLIIFDLLLDSGNKLAKILLFVP